MNVEECYRPLEEKLKYISSRKTLRSKSQKLTRICVLSIQVLTFSVARNTHRIQNLEAFPVDRYEQSWQILYYDENREWLDKRFLTWGTWTPRGSIGWIQGSMPASKETLV